MTLLITPPPHFRKQTSLINELRNLGLTSSLQACLDIGDANCYPGSGQAVTDLAGVTNFTLGDSAATEATADPTFVGTAGRETSGEYFRSPDYTYYLGSAVTAFATGLHRDNALFTLLAWTRLAQYDATNGGLVFSTGRTASGEPGTVFGQANAASGFGQNLTFAAIQNGGAVAALSVNAGLVVPVASPTFFAFSFDESAGTWNAQCNANQNSGSGATYSSPANAVGITLGMAIGGGPDPSGGYSSDTFAFSAWSRKLSLAEIDSVFQATRRKYGI